MILVSHAVHAEQACVAVLSGERGHLLRQAVLSHSAAQLAGRARADAGGGVPLSEQRLHDHKGHAVGALGAEGLEADGEVDVCHVVVALADVRADVVGLAARGDGRLRLSGHGAEVLVGKFGCCCVRHVADDDGVHAGGGVVGPHEVGEVVADDAVDVVDGPEDGVAEGLAVVRGGVQVVEYHLAHVLVHLVHLPQDGAALSVHRVAVVVALEQDIAEELHRPRHVFLQHARDVARVLARSVTARRGGGGGYVMPQPQQARVLTR